MTRSRRNHVILAVIFLDLNGLKKVNNDYGHEVGDLLLCEVARRLKQCLRELDMPARLGGDEFVVLVEGFTQASDVHLPAQRISHALSRPYQLGEHELVVSASMGISIFPDTSDSLEVLLQQSDQAMYQSKAAGTEYQFFQPKRSLINGAQMKHVREGII